MIYHRLNKCLFLIMFIDLDNVLIKIQFIKNQFLTINNGMN